MKKLKEHHIYAIARIPAFRDAWLSEVQPDWCVKKSDGTVFKDRDDHAWVNPYKEEAWDYLAEIALEAQKLGFDEIQFDYVRSVYGKGHAGRGVCGGGYERTQPDRCDPELYGI